MVTNKKRMSSEKLLINEPPLQVLPSLACAVGLNEAIVLQQIHYLAILNEKYNHSENCVNGVWGVQKSLKEWQTDHFPFWSIKTIQRAFDSLQVQGAIIVQYPDQKDWDWTAWRGIDPKWAMEGADVPEIDDSIGQDDQTDLVNLTKSIRTSCPTLNNELIKELIKEIHPILEQNFPPGGKADIRRIVDACLQAKGIDDAQLAMETSIVIYDYLSMVMGDKNKVKGAGGVLPAIGHGATKSEILKEKVEKGFSLNIDWGTKRWKKLIEFLKERPETEPIEDFINWWKTVDWRGKQNQAPTPEQIMELWPKPWSLEQQQTSAGVVPPNFGVNEDGSIYV